MTPEETKKFIEECKERGEAAARKWHSNPKVLAAAKNAAQSACSKIRDRERD